MPGRARSALLATAQTLPFLLLSIPAGLLADRWSRSRLMVLAEALRALSLLALLWRRRAARCRWRCSRVLGFVGAAGTVGFSVAAPALVPTLVPNDALATANARLELARSAAFAAGPALAGALVAWAGASAGVRAGHRAVGAATVAAAAPARAAARDRGRRATCSTSCATARGLVWRHPLLRPVLLTAVVWNIAWFVLQAAYVPYAMRVLGLDAGTVGFTLACYGAGMVIGRRARLARDARAAVRRRDPARPVRCRWPHRW